MLHKIKVSVGKLTKRLTENRAKHVAEYEAALKGWQVDLRNALEAWVAHLDNDVLPDRTHDVINDLERPQSHANDYDSALRMLEWVEGSEIALSGQEFQNLVDDDWRWTSNFKATSSKYSD